MHDQHSELHSLCQSCTYDKTQRRVMFRETQNTTVFLKPAINRYWMDQKISKPGTQQQTIVFPVMIEYPEGFVTQIYVHVHAIRPFFFAPM